MASSLAKFRHLKKATPEKMNCPVKPAKTEKDGREEFPIFTKDLYFSVFPLAIMDTSQDKKQPADPDDFLAIQIQLGSGRMGQAALAWRRDFNKYSCTRVAPPNKKELLVWLRMDSREVDYVDAVRILEPFTLATKRDSSKFVCHVLLSFRARSPIHVLQYHILCEHWTGQRSLCQCLNQAGKLSEGDARFYAAELAEALFFIHKYKKLVRRLCTCCLMVKSRGNLLLTPYTVCKQNLDCSQACNMLVLNCGDQFYASPEVVFGVDVEEATDWWSYGVIVFQMLTSQLPFTGKTLGDLGKSITESDVEIPSYLSPETSAFIKLLLFKDPRRRMTSVALSRHPFFLGIKWEDVRSLSMPIEPPFKTKTANNMETMKKQAKSCKYNPSC